MERSHQRRQKEKKKKRLVEGYWKLIRRLCQLFNGSFWTIFGCVTDWWMPVPGSMVAVHLEEERRLVLLASAAALSRDVTCLPCYIKTVRRSRSGRLKYEWWSWKTPSIILCFLYCFVRAYICILTFFLAHFAHIGNQWLTGVYLKL